MKCRAEDTLVAVTRMQSILVNFVIIKLQHRARGANVPKNRMRN